MSIAYPRLMWQEQELRAEAIVVIESWDRGDHWIEVQLDAVHWWEQAACPLRLGDVLALVRPGLPDVSTQVCELKVFPPRILLVTRWKGERRYG